MGSTGVPETRHFFFYLFMVSQMFVLFLIAAASLPDEPEGPINLRDFYAGIGATSGH